MFLVFDLVKIKLALTPKYQNVKEMFFLALNRLNYSMISMVDLIIISAKPEYLNPRLPLEAPAL